jgi:nucleoside-diphosphate-sugar epimerase
MRILVTGASGFVGRHVANYFRKRGNEVVTFDVASAQINGDISDRAFVEKRLSTRFDAMIHLAAIADVKKSIENPRRCYEVNVFGTLNLLELAAQQAVSRFVYASSANVYGVPDPQDLPVTEECRFSPRSPYDYSKVMAESMVQSYSTVRNLPSVIFRSWKMFGEYESFERAIPRFSKSCLLGESIPLFNRGEESTDLYYVENYCHALELAITKDAAVKEVFNVGTGVERKIIEVAETIKRLTSSNSKLELLPPRTEIESKPMRSYPSVKKLEAKLAYRPIVSFEAGLKRTIDWVAEQVKK